MSPRQVKTFVGKVKPFEMSRLVESCSSFMLQYDFYSFVFIHRQGLNKPTLKPAAYKKTLSDREKYFLPDPGVPGVRSMGPVVTHSLREV